MKIHYIYDDVASSTSLEAYIKEKLEKLSDKFQFIVAAHVYIKHDENDHEAGKICNIELSLPGPRIFATSNEVSYEAAVNETIRDLTRQLEKRKEVFKTH